MRIGDLARLLALATIWSLSFVFLRVLVPQLGPVWTATLRVLIAGVALVVWLRMAGADTEVRRHWRAYLFLGVVNFAVPFVLFAYAAQRLPASYLVIIIPQRFGPDVRRRRVGGVASRRSADARKGSSASSWARPA